MLEAEKTPRTSTVRIAIKGSRERLFVVPAKKAASLIILLSDYRLADSVPAEVVFPELADPQKKPGAMLRGARLKEGLTQTRLAERIGTSQAAIAAMEKGTRPIGKRTAQKLAALFSTDYRLFL